MADEQSLRQTTHLGRLTKTALNPVKLPPAKQKPFPKLPVKVRRTQQIVKVKQHRCRLFEKKTIQLARP